MITIAYEWRILTNDGRTKTFEDYPKHETNYFKNREDAIAWLKRMNEEDEDFAEPFALVLQEMFFTNSDK